MTITSSLQGLKQILVRGGRVGARQTSPANWHLSVLFRRLSGGVRRSNVAQHLHGGEPARQRRRLAAGSHRGRKQRGYHRVRQGLRGTITLTSGELLVTDSVTINGPGANQLSVSGNNASRVFEIAAGQNVTISGLTITHGSAPTRGAAS